VRRVVAATAIILGAGMIVAPAALSLFSRASAAEHLTDDIRPAMTDTALARTRAEFDSGRAALTDFADHGIPRLATDLGQTPAQFRASIDARFPDVATGVQQLPAITATVDGAITLFDENRARFHSADAIPTSGLPYTVGPWMLIGFGILLVLLGLAVALRRGGRRTMAALALLGLFLAVMPVAVRFPQKASDGRQLVAALRTTLSRPTADQLRVWQTTVDKMTSQLQSGLLPAVAGQLHLSPQGMDDYLRRNVPALAAGLPALRATVTHMGTLVATVERNVPTYDKTRRIPFRALAWLFVIPGALVCVTAAVGLLGSSTAGSGARRAAPVPTP